MRNTRLLKCRSNWIRMLLKLEQVDILVFISEKSFQESSKFLNESGEKNYIISGTKDFMSRNLRFISHIFIKYLSISSIFQKNILDYVYLGKFFLKLILHPNCQFELYTIVLLSSLSLILILKCKREQIKEFVIIFELNPDLVLNDEEVTLKPSI